MSEWLDVVSERQRRVEVEGWTPDRDTGLHAGNLASACSPYALIAAAPLMGGKDTPIEAPPLLFRFEAEWNAITARRDMIKALVLECAELERMDGA